MVLRATVLASEPMLMILPPRPRLIMRRAASRPTWKAAVRCVSTIPRHSLVVTSSIGLRSWFPALLTRMSIARLWPSKCSKAAVTAASSATSNARAKTRRPSASRDFAAAASFFSFPAVENDGRAGRCERARHSEAEAL